MPRNVKESDEDVETKGGRKTRASVISSVLDSPLRRSTRIKHPAGQDASSPESVSDASSIPTTRTTRRRVATGDTGVPEGGRMLRVRRNSATSDISEATETESLPDGPAKRITRRSVAGVPSVETPTKLNGRTRRTTRAGSETKSTPPVVRVTRRTRASSMEPEMIEESNDRQFGTPMKSRRRASVMPSEPVVNEESDDGKSINVRKSEEKTVYEVDENDSETSPQNIATSLRQKSKDDANESDEKMEVDSSPVKASEADTVERSVPEIAEATIDASARYEDSSKTVNIIDESVKIDEASDVQKISTPSKGSSQIIENIVTNSTEKQNKSPGNKENEVFNNGVGTVERNVNVANNDVRSINRKAYANLFKITEQRRRGSNDNESLVDHSESKTPTRTEETVGAESEKRSSENVLRKEYLVDECVVVIEPMDINQVDKAVVPEPSVIADLPKTGDDTIPNIVSSPNLAQHSEEQIDTSVKLNVENNENPTNDKDIVEGDSSLKILNVMSMSVTEEKSDKEIEAVEENETKTIQSSEPIETIDLGVTVEEKEEEISLKVTSESVKNDEICKERSTNTADTIDPQSSINDEKSQEIEENVVCEMVKEKSSIVTESPVSGTNVEEASGLSNEQNKDKSTLAEDSSEALQKDDEAESSPTKKSVASSKVLETDNESDCSGYPAFKDITADEWTGAHNEHSKKHNEDETNSVHSASTERNESECDIELVDKESLLTVDKRKEVRREAQLDYDTDDTVITQINPETESMEKNSEQMKVINEETPMDLSSDLEEDEQNTSDSPKKRLSSANKNVSPANWSVRRGASFIDTDDDSTMPDSPGNDEENVSKSKKSPSKSPKKRTPSAVGRRKIDDSSDDEDTENSVTERPKTGQTPNRKSVDASAKKLTPGKNNVSTKNTPSADEMKANESPAKRRSSNKFASVYSFNDSDEVSSQHLDRSELSTGSGLTQSTQSEVDDADVSLKITPATPQDTKKQKITSIETGSAKKIGANRSKCEDGDLAPDSGINGGKPEKSEKQGSAKKSVANKNANRVSGPESPKKSANDKGNWKKTLMSMESPNVFIEELNESTKPASSRKLSINKNSPKIVRTMQLDSDSEDGEEQESPVKLSKSKLANENDNSKVSALIDSDSESDTNVSKKTPAKIVSQLNKSAKSGSVKKLSISKNSSKIAQKNSDSEVDEDEKSQQKPIKSLIERASKFFIDADKNCSTIAQVNSDSEAEESSSSDEIGDSSLIPQFFFERDSTSSSNSSVENDDDSSDTIDSDVARDLNLHGKSMLEYSDDDVPADDCATESESSDSDDDGADLLDFVVDDDDEDSFGEEQSNDSFSNVNEKIRKRIITNLESDSDSDDNAEPLESIELDKSVTAKTPKKDKKLNKSKDHSASVENGDFVVTDDKLDLDKSVAAKTPKKDKKLNKSQEVAEPEIPSAELNVSAKAAAKKNKNLLLQSSTPKGAVREVSSFKKDGTPKSVTPLSKSLKNADSSLKKDNTPKSVTPLSKSIKNADVSLKKDNTPKSVTPLSKSMKNVDSSMKIETSQILSAKKLSKSVCEVVETPTKLGSSFKVAKTPKTPATDEQQLQISLPTDLTDSATKTNLSKAKSTKLSALNQTMMTPNTDTSETRFLMKEKLNDSLPALKLQQKAKASRRSTLDNVCEEIASTEEQAAIFDEEVDEPAEKNVTISEEAAVVIPEVGSEKKKKNKKKKAKNMDTSNEPETESFSVPKEIKRTLNVDESTESLDNDASNKLSKKRNKKKKISETETEEPVVSQTEETTTKNKKKKKREENIEQANDANTNDKTKKKKKRIEVVDESQNDEIMKKQSKKNKKRDEPEEIAAAPISKNKLPSAEKHVGANDFATLSDQKKQTKKKQLQSTVETRDQRKVKTRSVIETGIETSKTNLKRLSDEILESLSGTPERPKKRRKIVKTEKVVPSRTMFDARHQPPMSLNVDDGYISLSASGATTQFQVVNLKKTAKKSKKTVAALSFRERMLARNPRQPISAYLMYQQKQKASGKDRPY